MLLTEKRRECQTLLHPELTPWWSFLLADGAYHKKPHSLEWLKQVLYVGYNKVVRKCIDVYRSYECMQAY